jgi:hypothetical protein
MARKKKVEEKEFEKQLETVEFPECDGGQSRRQNEIIDLLKQLVNQNKKIISLLEKQQDKFSGGY